ncbi:MAG: hypothetical protein Q8P46_10055 [Hyphomicrobiales bacterium]|nr:hypothetical protein [Hyphomicrobiales bacterium]
MANAKKPARKDDRRDRLAKALRANLARRKAQERARGARQEAAKEKVPKR